MGLWDKLRGHAGAQFLDVIEWLEDDRKTILYKYPAFNQAIQDNSKLVVREGQSGVFQAEGKISDSFGPGTYDLNTRTQAIWSFFESIKYGLNYPYKGDIFFVSTRQFTDQKWGTPGGDPHGGRKIRDGERPCLRKLQLPGGRPRPVHPRDRGQHGPVHH